MKLSVIIPVYRVQDTLDRCMESVLGQTFTDLEVVLIDDGSTDECPQMCEAWAARDSRVTVVHKENGGLSDARNAGIDVARGELLTFVDSDDYLEPHTYEQVMPLMTDADIVEFPVYWHFGGKEQTVRTYGDCFYNDMKEYWLKAKAYEHAFAWNKIYRRTLFEGVRFPVGRVFEDVATLPSLLKKSHTVATCSRGCYYYCVNASGITATASGADLRMLLEHHIEAMKIWIDDSYYMHVLNIQMDVCELTGDNPILPHRRIRLSAPSLNATQRIKALVLNLLGTKGICQLNKTIHKLIKHHS